MAVEEDAASQVRRLVEGGHSVVLLFCDPESAARAQGVFQDPRPNSTVILTRPAAERSAGVPEPWKRVPMVPQVEAYTTAGRVQEFEVSPVHLFIFLSALWVIGFKAAAFFPQDDLLRHAVAYLWNYDYGVPYASATHSPSFDFYIGFDVLAGTLHRAMGDWALLVLQFVPLVLLFVAMARFLKGADPWLRIVALTVGIVLLFPRISLGRPSLLCSSLMMVIFAYHDVLPAWSRYLMSAALSPIYYLFFIYHLPLLLLDRRYLFTLAAGLAFWLVYSGGDYFREIGVLLTSLSGSKVTENYTIAGFLAGTWLLLLPLLLHWRKDVPKALTVLFFLGLNQVRYVESVLPLLVSFLRHMDLKVRPVVGLGLVFFALYTAPVRMHDVAREIPRAMPQGSRVLSESMTTAYHLIYHNPALHVAPSYNLGWTDPGVRSALTSLSRGALDCDDPALASFDYLVEQSLSGPPPSCLDLVLVEKGRRLWKVLPRSESAR